MNNLKYGVWCAALVGLVACFLPLTPVSDTSVWALRNQDVTEVLFTMGSFALVLIVMSIPIAKPPMARWQPMTALCAFAFVALRLRDVLVDLVTRGALGGKLIAIAPVIGIVLAALCVAKAAPGPAAIS